MKRKKAAKGSRSTKRVPATRRAGTARRTQNAKPLKSAKRSRSAKTDATSNMGRSGKSKRAGALGKSVKAGKSSKAKPRTEPKVTVPAAVAGALRRMFDKTGYVREPSPYKRRKFGEAYKKGYEVRLVVATRAELRTLRSLLKRAGFPVRRAFEKHSKLVQPVYGYDAFKWFTQSR